jgi:hypothetical protein
LGKVKKDNNGYYVQHANVTYPFKDDKAGQVIEKYQVLPISAIAVEILGSAEIWGEDLAQLPLFPDTVQHYLDKLIKGDLISSADE